MEPGVRDGHGVRAGLESDVERLILLDIGEGVEIMKVRFIYECIIQQNCQRANGGTHGSHSIRR